MERHGDDPCTSSEGSTGKHRHQPAYRHTHARSWRSQLRPGRSSRRRPALRHSPPHQLHNTSAKTCRLQIILNKQFKKVIGFTEFGKSYHFFMNIVLFFCFYKIKSYLCITFWFATTRLIGNPVRIRNRPATVIPTKLIDIMSLSDCMTGRRR